MCHTNAGNLVLYAPILVLTTNVYLPSAWYHRTCLSKTIPRPHLCFMVPVVNIQVSQDVVWFEFVTDSDFEEGVGGKSRVSSNGDVGSSMSAIELVSDVIHEIGGLRLKLASRV